MSHQSECVSVCVCAHSRVSVFTAICECVDGFWFVFLCLHAVRMRHIMRFYFIWDSSTLQS